MDDSAGMILVVDDDADIREALAMMLIEEGYLVETAMNGAEALQLVAKLERPLLILLDLTMPLMDGQTCLQHLQLTRPDIPVVIVTAVGHRAPAGAIVVDKPIDYQRLMHYVRQYCGERAA